jgi:hypothetical protein
MLTMALLVSIFSVAAYAAEITCGTPSDRDPNPVDCEGTNDGDDIDERLGDNLDDVIRALGGRDVVLATEYDDDNDRLFGGADNDRLRTDDGDGEDFINCGSGNKDVAVADKGDNVNKKTCERVSRR